jgi:DNA mismatch endonuclease, patch repair protein
MGRRWLRPLALTSLASRSVRATWVGAVVDPLTPNERSRVMSHIGGKNTKPELELKRALRRAGIRFASFPALPGRPDLLLPGRNTVVFVHGCFWHGCRAHYHAPGTRAAFWRHKLRENMARDRRVRRILRVRGWKVAVVWECKLERDADLAVVKLARRHPLNERGAQPAAPGLRSSDFDQGASHPRTLSSKGRVYRLEISARV